MPVRGNLDAPPIVVRTSMWRSLLSLALLLAAGGYLAWRLGQDWPDDEHAALFIILGGTVVGLLACDLVWPARLTIDRKGLRQSGLWRTRRWSWAEVADFRVLAVALGGRRVGFDYSVGRGDGRLEGQGAPLGADAALPGGWELGPARLAELLNQARMVWSSSDSQSPHGSL